MRLRFALWLLSACLLAHQALAREPQRARYGMVVAMEGQAAAVGADVLRRGGNAVDAAVAVGFALAVTQPNAGNIGGGGYMLLRMADGRSSFIDFRERAPAAAARDMYLDATGEATRGSIEGWRAVGVPGTVRGLAMALGQYGTWAWGDTLQPAISLAQQGYVVSPAQAKHLQSAKNLATNTESRRVFQRDGRFFAAGERLQQPNLAATLSRLVAHGPDEFYTGATGRQLARAMRENGGLISEADLRDYRAIERPPLQGSYKGYTLLTAPPSSSGGVVILQTLGMLEGTAFAAGGQGSASVIHWLAEAMRRSYADRNAYLGDPDFVTPPVAGLLDRSYLAQRRAGIDPKQATPSATLKAGTPEGVEREQTTHYTVVDAAGNAVAVTYTLNGYFGNGITVPGLGFLLNNEMDDFAARRDTPNMFGLVQGEANAIAPGKRPLSSMSPTIVLKEGKLYMTLGAPGGSRIPSAVLQTFVNVVDFGLNLQDAVDSPRMHHQWLPDRLYLERGISPDTAELLKNRGHAISQSPGVVLAAVSAIRLHDGWIEGAPDGRSADSRAIGLDEPPAAR